MVMDPEIVASVQTTAMVKMVNLATHYRMTLGNVRSASHHVRLVLLRW